MRNLPAAGPDQIADRIILVRGKRVLILEDQDFAILRSQFATSSFSSPSHGGRRHLPRVFTEHGAIMAAMVLNSERAIQMSTYVVRAFVELKKTIDRSDKIERRLEALERSVAALDADTRKQFDQVYEAILGLMKVLGSRQWLGTLTIHHPLSNFAPCSTTFLAITRAIHSTWRPRAERNETDVALQPRQPP